MPVDSVPNVHFRLKAVASCLLALLASQCGCDAKKVAQATDESVTAPALPTADPTAIMRQMEQAYQTADRYSDRAVVVLRYRERGDIHSDEAPLAVKARLPNELRIEAYYAVVACREKRLWAKISDEGSNDIDGQILNRELSGGFTLEQLYKDATLREALTSGMGGQPLQLDLLFAEDPLSSVLAASANCESLEPAMCDGDLCYRIAASGAEGKFVFWVDGVTSVLRRLDFPASTLLPELARSKVIQDLSLRIEFRDATFEPTLSDADFQIDIPDDAKQVRSFVLPPQPLPTELFGKTPGDFTCYNMDGSKVERNSLLGKTTVLLWYNDHPACRSTVEQLSEVYAERRDDESLAIYAVSTEPTRVANLTLKATLDAWETDVPLLRDFDACGRDVLGVPWTPTMIVFDAKGAVHIFEVGANNDLALELPTIIDRLQNGHDLATEIIADHEKQKANYRQLMDAATEALESALGSLPANEASTTDLEESADSVLKPQDSLDD